MDIDVELFDWVVNVEHLVHVVGVVGQVKVELMLLDHLLDTRTVASGAVGIIPNGSGQK